MPLTTGSGYTFPTPAPTTQNPSSGTPYTPSNAPALDNYENWNGDWNGYLQYMSQKYGDEWTDRWFNWMSSEQSNIAAREWTASREDTQYQRLVEDLKASGINPYILMQSGGASGASSSSSGTSYSGAYSSNKSMKDAANSTKWASVLASLFSTIIVATIAAL